MQSKSAIKPKLFQVVLNTKFFDCARYTHTEFNAIFHQLPCLHGKCAGAVEHKSLVAMHRLESTVRDHWR